MKHLCTCGTRSGSKARFCGGCGQPMATVKAAAALRANGFYEETSPEAREVLFKSAYAGVLTKGAA